MYTLVKEHRYFLATGMDNLVLRVEEFVSGVAPASQSFRLQLPAAPGRSAKTFYGRRAKA